MSFNRLKLSNHFDEAEDDGWIDAKIAACKENAKLTDGRQRENELANRVINLGLRLFVYILFVNKNYYFFIILVGSNT
jgi:hypothetical protein